MALADMPLDLVQHVLFLFFPTRVLVLPGGPRLAAGNDGCVPPPTANSQPKKQHFLSQSFVACPTQAPENRPGGPGRGRCSSWLVPADVKACFSSDSRSRVGRGQLAVGVSGVVSGKVVGIWESAGAARCPALPPESPATPSLARPLALLAFPPQKQPIFLYFCHGCHGPRA